MFLKIVSFTAFSLIFLLPITCIKESGKRCFLVQDQIFPRPLIIDSGEADEFIRNLQSIILDFYKSPIPYAVRLFSDSRNRHLMVVKVLMEAHNLSIDACNVSSALPNISFGLTTFEEQKEKLKTSVLLHSREQFRIAFMAVKKPDYSKLFFSLASPVGWPTLVISVGTMVILAFCIKFCKIFEQWSRMQNCIIHIPRKVSIWKITWVLFRTFVDQCVEGRKLRSLCIIRDIYIGWLIYSVIITSTYKGNLVETLLRPSYFRNLETFSDLEKDKRPIIVMVHQRPGKQADTTETLRAEVEAKQDEILRKVLDRYDRSGSTFIPDAIKGAFNVLEDASTLIPISKILETFFGISHYAVGKEQIVREEFWAVERSEISEDIIKTLRILAQAGIIDHFGKEQQIAEFFGLRYMAHVIIGMALMGEDNVEDNGMDEILQDGVDSYFSRVKSIKTPDMSNRPKALKMEGLLVPWVLLGVGHLSAALVFIGKISWIRCCKMFRGIRVTWVESFG